MPQFILQAFRARFSLMIGDLLAWPGEARKRRIEGGLSPIDIPACNHSTKEKAAFAGAVILGLALVAVVPALAQWQISRIVSQSVQSILIYGVTMGLVKSARHVCLAPVRYAAVLAMLALLACGPATATKLQPAEEAVGVAATQEPAPLPLSEPGPYRVGVREFSSQDASRDGRGVGVRVWYPAVWPEGETAKRLIPLADPDPSGAPYPLILSSAKVGAILAPYLVTHGFAWAGVTRIDSYDHMNEQMFDQPLDILFALDQVASNPPEELAGMIDSEHAGAIGYSFDGYNALALSGARIDPEFYLAQCANADATTEAVLSVLSSYHCAPAQAWDEFAAHAGQAINTGRDGLWQPMTDARIRAVMPMAGEGWWLFGKRGLASVDRPTLILVATEDELYRENALIFEHLGTPDKTLISFVGPDHYMVYDPEMIARMAHFAVAFFGYHLQGHEDLAWYFSEDFVAQHDDLAWGVYVDE